MNALVENFDLDSAELPTRTASTGPSNILVVDDLAAIRRVNSLVLGRAGYHVEEAEDGAAAWEATRRHNYDLVITGNQMPGLSGLEFVTKLREARMPVPVVLASGTLDSEELLRHRWLALAAILPKPYSAEQLIATVQRVLGARGDIRERHSVGFSFLSDSLSRIQPFPRWGINE